MCVAFKGQHPDIRRHELATHYYAYYRAICAFGLLDSLYPNRNLKSSCISYGDCVRYKRKNPNLNRDKIRKIYYNAMRRLGCLDELYPRQNVAPLNAEELAQERRDLIELASRYRRVADLKRDHPKELQKIYHRKLQKEAFAHMTPYGNKMWRMIYAYEFSDKSAYVGLTCNIECRNWNHLCLSNNSAVSKHIKETGLKPKLVHLTNYVPVADAQRLEGEYVEKYRHYCWLILNRCKTGTVGGCVLRINPKDVVEEAKKGATNTEIMNKFGISRSSVRKILRENGVATSKGVPVEVVEDESVVCHFGSLAEAARYYGIQMQSVVWRIKHKVEVNGQRLRFDRIQYRRRWGHFPSFQD